MDLAETTKGGNFMEYSWNIGVLMGYIIYIQYIIWYMYGIYSILMGYNIIYIYIIDMVCMV
jgi:hypothetical protein